MGNATELIQRIKASKESHLDLRFLKVQDVVTMQLIAEAIAGNPNIVSVDLESCTVPKGALYELRRCSHLRNLNLANTACEDIDVQAIVTGLYKLQTLNISHNSALTNAILGTVGSNRSLQNVIATNTALDQAKLAEIMAAHQTTPFRHFAQEKVDYNTQSSPTSTSTRNVSKPAKT